jgi:drug/metabolite transporter (DMT)-like permease
VTAPLPGLAAAAGAAALFETAYVLQALEARAVEEPRARRASLLLVLARRPLWLAATALSLAGAGLQLLALSLAPLTLVQPTLALGLPMLLYLGRRVLGEPVGPRERAAALAVIAGVATVAGTAPPRVSALPDAASTAVVLGALGALVVVPPLIDRLASRSAWLVLGAGAADAWAALAAKLAADALDGGQWGVAAAWGGGALAALGLGLTAEMTALRRLPVRRVAPPIMAMQVVVPVALAPPLLGEDWSSTPLGGVVLLAGLAAVVAGTWRLAGSPAVSGLRDAGPTGVGGAGERDHRVRGVGQVGN